MGRWVFKSAILDLSKSDKGNQRLLIKSHDSILNKRRQRRYSISFQCFFLQSSNQIEPELDPFVTLITCVCFRKYIGLVVINVLRDFDSRDQI